MPRIDISTIKPNRTKEVGPSQPVKKKREKKRKSLFTPEELEELKTEAIKEISKIKSKQNQALEDENARLAQELAALKAELSRPKLTANEASVAPIADSSVGRMDTVMRGVKQGAIKSAVDKTVGLISGPLTDSIVEKLLEANPKLAIAGDPIIRAVLNFAFMMGIAELLNYAGPLSGQEKLARKSELLSKWMRSYAGEKLGEEALEAAVQAVPLVISIFSEINLEDLELVIGDEDDTSIEKKVTEDLAIPAIV